MSAAGVLIAEGAALRAQGRFEDASRILQRAVTLAPDDPAGWVALIDCELAGRRPEVALQVGDAGLRRLPDNPALLAARAAVLRHESRLDEARALLQRALELDPGERQARLGLIGLEIEEGDWDAAEVLAAPFLAASPPRADAMAFGARIAFARHELETARQRCEAALAVPGLSPDQTAEIALLLGEVLDALDRPREAFQASSRGKGELHRLYAARAAGRESETAKLNRLADWFDAADPAPWRSPAEAGTAAGPAVRAHAFLVGFPRSGTTLLEQALAGHPELTTLEEAPTLAGAYDALMTSPEALERLAYLDAAEAEAWRAAYWTEVDRAGANPAGKVFLDKAPAGTLYLPLIAKLFPAARILFAIRDPRDVALSCFRNHFQMNALTYAFTDLAETARCYAASMRMAEIYRRVLPLELTEVRYEALVDDFTGELARIAGFLGLDAAAAMHDVAATARRRTVRTPSAAQVRAGLNRQGLARWQAYADDLAPVLPILAPWVERFGYDRVGAAG